ncbi:MAG TPA: DMT family transporter [Methanocorpusculum sp.]|nr:DMT family transporter [Methanocorpusculum sp.]
MNAKTAILLAVLSGVLFAFLTPLSAVFLETAAPVFTITALNTGAGIGMALLLLFTRKTKNAEKNEKIKKKDIPYLILITIADLLAAIFTILSLTYVSADSISLVLNFEIVATALIAFSFFKEKISKRLGIAIALITLGCIVITAGDLERFVASPGIPLALAACVCWGISSNLYQKVTHLNPALVVTIRSFGIGIMAFIISLIIGETISGLSLILIMMIIGFVIYGLGNIFLILSRKKLGAGLTAAIFGFSPFLSAFISLLIFRESITLNFTISLILLIPGVYLAVTEGIKKEDTLSPDTLLQSGCHLPDIRNTLSAIGYFITGSIILYNTLRMLAIPQILTVSAETHFTLLLCCSIFLLLIGTILIILRKRDFNGITFIVYATISMILSLFTGNRLILFAMGIFVLILGGIFLLSLEKKKYFISLLFLFQGFQIIMIITAAYSHIVANIISFILIGLVFFIGICSSALLPDFKFGKILTSDEVTSFRKNGLMIEYMVFALSIIPWIMLYMTGSHVTSVELISWLTIICLSVMAIVAILMIFVGKSWFSGGIFIGIAFAMALLAIGEGPIYISVGIFLMLLGLLSALRKPSYLLLGLMIIVYGISALTSVSVTGMIQMQFVQLLFNVIPFVIAIYMAAALFSEKIKLPIF